MDQGLVALLSAGVGLVGAIGGAAIGGLAAARGARIGAETAARATVKQVRDQADIDHDHWLRGQRLDACRAFFVAYDEYGLAASNMTRAVERGIAGSEELVGQEFGRSMTNFRNAFFQVRLVAPAAVRERALQLATGVEDHYDSVRNILAMDGSAMAAAQAEEERLRYELGGIWNALMEAVTDSVARRPMTE
ncbi:hypothetical protein AB0D37_35650 [Streptomyces sp. NPDC048384]|uniref:hypothetical protein n=1 Tax=Streptomyces sp. NPDC048384 TaxID=3155487 RepID=UPI003436C3F7